MPTDEAVDVDPEGVAEYSSFEQPFSKLNPEKSENIEKTSSLFRL